MKDKGKNTRERWGGRQTDTHTERERQTESQNHKYTPRTVHRKVGSGGWGVGKKKYEDDMHVRAHQVL